MSSIRRKLTIWYTVALGITVLVFGTALYLERRQSSLKELDQRLRLEADIAANYLSESHRVLGRILTADAKPTLVNEVGTYFDGVRDFVVVVDSAGSVIFLNEAAVPLSYPDFVTLAHPVQPPPVEPTTGGMSLGLGNGPIRFVALPVTKVWSTPGGVLVAAPAESVAFGPEQLLQAMLVIGPIILAGSVGLGYVLADTSLRPVEGMMDELKAISDGRGLHRRLVVPQVDELARLAVTMNGMLERLEQSFASLRRFTADASHELKTPLMVLRVGVERALTHAGTPPEALEALDETLEQINRMTEMVDSLLTLARADEGIATLAVIPTDLRQLVEEASETANILGEGPGISVRTEIPDTPVILAVDESRIRQLLLNLVTNAIKYTPPDGRISLGLVDRGESVALVVGDNGIGIAPTDLPHIFDRFWRADVARDRSGGRPGTGLGLAITKWIAEAHGGTIAAQSRPGRGTVFTVTLPRPAAVGSELPESIEEPQETEDPSPL
ncbi:MAG: HAMP domain-containing sensor histidine kinase [Gemmatimonadota bacterium]